MSRADIGAIAEARELLVELLTRREITEEIRARIERAEMGLFFVLFPGAGQNDDTVR